MERGRIKGKGMKEGGKDGDRTEGREGTGRRRGRRQDERKGGKGMRRGKRLDEREGGKRKERKRATEAKA